MNKIAFSHNVWLHLRNDYGAKVIIGKKYEVNLKLNIAITPKHK